MTAIYIFIKTYYYEKDFILIENCIVKSHHFNEFIDDDGIFLKNYQNVHNFQLK